MNRIYFLSFTRCMIGHERENGIFIIYDNQADILKNIV